MARLVPLKKKAKAPRRAGGGPIVHDWQPLFAAIKDVIDWAARETQTFGAKSP